MPGIAYPETETDTEGGVALRLQPPYAVILHNDDHNGMDFVVGVLQTVFRYELEKCMQLMMEAHETGRAVVWVGSLELAELKAEQMQSCGRDKSNAKSQPLRVTIEPTE